MSDIGPDLLAHVHKTLLIDEQWTVRGAREFTWLGHRLFQRIHVSESFQSFDLEVCQLTASTVVVDDVSEPEATVEAVLNDVNRHVVGGAYSFDSESGQIVATAGAVVHEQTRVWRTAEFAQFAILQLCAAETEASYLAGRTGGRLAMREHPTEGLRHAPDDMLTVLDRLIAVQGSEPTRFAVETEMHEAADTIGRGPLATFGATANELVFEAGFGDTTSLVTLLTDEPHRRAGNGMTVRLNLPLRGNAPELQHLANMLNAYEAQGHPRSAHYGAWCCDDWPMASQALSYNLFVPNAFYRPGLILNIATSISGRAMWVDRVVNETPTAVNPWVEIARRFGWSSDEDE